MSQQPPRPRRPLLGADLVHLHPATGPDPATVHDAAHNSAATVVRAARDGQADLPELLHLADTLGLDEMALLWRASERSSLPCTLWTLYVLRSWCHHAGQDVAQLWQRGLPHAEVAAAVAGLPDTPTGSQLAAFADALLEGILLGDQSATLHRAAGFFRVIATGRADLPDTGHAEPELGFCALSTADELDRAAAASQAGVWA